MELELRALSAADFEALDALHGAYKREIGEEAPSPSQLEALHAAIQAGEIAFYGGFEAGRLAGICSICRVFSTFSYGPVGVFEDFYIRPECRHRGIARKLALYACERSGADSVTVGCADCDAAMYDALGFTLRLGDMRAWLRED